MAQTFNNTCLAESGRNSFPCTTSAASLVSLGIAAGVFALLFVAHLYRQLKKAPKGNELMNRIAAKIKSGARAFVRAEYAYLSVFVVIFFLFLVVLYTLDPPSGDKTDGIRYGGCFLVGAVLSAGAGWGGMNVATSANVRTTQAAQDRGLAAALRVAFTGGAVVGFFVTGLAVLGLSVMYVLMTLGYPNLQPLAKLSYASDALAGFSFGASSIALFARVAGGIFTKAADVGADLVGKIELDIPEDDARNPAVIADNVGDNVGDVAGMGADLFESYVGSIVAAVALAGTDTSKILLPFWIAGAGIVAAALSFFTVSTKDGAKKKDLMRALNKGTLLASILVIAFSIVITIFVFEGREKEGWQIFACIILGLIAGVLIGNVTEFFTSYSYWPTQSIAQAGITGPATVIIQGLGIGMLSTIFPVILLVGTILACDALAGQYGIAIAAVGMLSTLGITLATDAYGPIVDNAGGIAEMAQLDGSVREITDVLDAVGNTTAATGKGFAIGSAVLTALSLLSAFTESAFFGVPMADQSTSITEPIILSGVLIGAMLPFLFAALAMLSVQKATGAIIIEVRRQFADIPGLREGSAEADSDKCVTLLTRSAVKEMILPGLYAVLTPLTVGFLVGPRCLTGLLGGAIASGMMLALMMANAGGAWDNAKKYVEIENVYGGKGTETHKACIVGDTVGDPFKDTSGPSLNILIKLMSIISLVVAPILNKNPADWANWYYGLIPLGILVASTFSTYRLLWRQTVDFTGDITSVAAKEVPEAALA